MLDQAAKRINNYVFHLKDKIGEGFSSVVYKGRHIENQTPFAIKVIELKKIINEVEKELLSNQIIALRTTNSPNIIKLHEIYQTANNVYIVMDFGETTLAQMISKRIITQIQAISILSKLVDGFIHLTELSIIHRDVKPANIVFVGNCPKLLDFGFCQIINNNGKIKKFYNVGSPKYMSPEAYKKTHYTHKSDLWGLGIVFLEMLLGNTLFDGMQYDEMVRSIAMGECYSKTKITGFSKMILSKMLSVDVERRFDFAQLKNILVSNMSQNAVNSTPVLIPNGMLTKMQMENRKRNSLLVNRTYRISSKDLHNKQKDKINQTTNIPLNIQNIPPIVMNPDMKSSMIVNKQNLSERVFQNGQPFTDQNLFDKTFKNITNNENISFQSNNIQTLNHINKNNIQENKFTKGSQNISLPKNYNIVKETNQNKIQKQSKFKREENTFQTKIIGQPKCKGKIHLLLKIISIMHSDPCVRLNGDKIRLLKICYWMAQYQLKLDKQQFQSQRQAELSNLQIILSGYSYLTFQQIPYQDRYYQYILKNLQELPAEQVSFYIDFWTLNCLKIYYKQYNISQNIELVNKDQNAYCGYLLLKRLVDLHFCLTNSQLNQNDDLPRGSVTLQSLNFIDNLISYNGQ